MKVKSPSCDGQEAVEIIEIFEGKPTHENIETEYEYWEGEGDVTPCDADEFEAE